ncbi:hypothetical protein HAX54_006515, partial [Datura stramonium]|nr:hypothetical protein [Datura stramonium]
IVLLYDVNNCFRELDVDVYFQAMETTTIGYSPVKFFMNHNRMLTDESLMKSSMIQCSAYCWQYHRWSADHFLWLAGVPP